MDDERLLREGGLAPGWYQRDEVDEMGGWHYWDGRRWTERWQRSPRWYRSVSARALWFGIAAICVGLLMLGGASSGGGDDGLALLGFVVMGVGSVAAWFGLIALAVQFGVRSARE